MLYELMEFSNGEFIVAHVLILVLLENALRDVEFHDVLFDYDDVLILVLLENALRESANEAYTNSIKPS